MWRSALLPLPRQYHAASSALRKDATATKIDGAAIAQEIKQEIGSCVDDIKSKLGFAPGLAIFQVGDAPQSQAYVKSIRESCIQVGIDSHALNFPTCATQDEIISALSSFNTNDRVHGIIVQLPLPQHIQSERLLRQISLAKDVDGLHPINLGRLALGSPHPSFLPCTPLGCMELLRRHKVDLENKHVVVLGCSNVVGLPTALLLQSQNATVTVVNKDTWKPAEVAREADVLISATGNANLVRGHWIKPGAIVIDVGVNLVEQDSEAATGFSIIGDVCFEEAEKIASAITPVPGGVGPMTVAMLLSNTLISAQRACKYGLAN